MKKILLCFSLLILVISSCKNDDGKGSDYNSDECYLNTNAQTLVHDGIDREYIIYVPNSYDGTSAVPLLFNFHGFGGSASEFINDADMRAEAEANSFILVYPQGSCLNGASHWNPCPIDGDNKSSADDLGFVEALVNEVSSQYTIDLERIYAAGYSNGGMMAYGLANYKSNLIAAIASVSGSMLDCIGSTSHPIPVLHLHGTSDGVIPYDGSNDYSSVQSTLDYWTSFNNTISTPTINVDTTGGMTIEHYVYGQGDNSVSVEHYKYIGGDHVWFNEPYQGQNASNLVWSFMSKYDINGLR
jgi:polyhydroxybutyrate depolymerase